jgi:hypothetical protein
MVIKPLLIPAVLAAFLLGSADAPADSYRCGRKLIRTGDEVSKLIEVCGQPRRKDSGKQTLVVDGRLRQVKVQRWHYRMGSRRLERVVMLYRGKVAAIEVASR